MVDGPMQRRRAIRPGVIHVDPLLQQGANGRRVALLDGFGSAAPPVRGTEAA